ncbi:MAG: class I SAM-dependent methyltransferase [Pseudomonadota bacterium]
MDPVAAQYEAFPYPARAPAEEASRLIEGSPSHPVEIDHFLFGGRRDWTQPFRVLVAGGGTGDALVMLAQKLADIDCPAEITYLDLSQASRAIAEARMAARGLTARFLTADLLAAPAYGPFDYIDCCGVLHHLPEPDAGFRALAAAVAPGGGMGLMVYAPHGRTGVYALQDAFGALLAEDPPRDKVALARDVIEALPESNWLRRNPFVRDYRDGDAGLYDLLLHARDRAYEIGDLEAALARAGLAVAGVLEPARYDPMRYLPGKPEIAERVRRLSPPARMALAERLAGNIKTHVVYAVPQARAADLVPPRPLAELDLVPHTRLDARALAQHVAKEDGFRLTLDGVAHRVDFSRGGKAPGAGRRLAPLIAGIDGTRSLGEIARSPLAAGWEAVDTALTGFNLLHYSIGARR